jgi:ribosomal protein L37AE/L43A
MKYLFPSQDNLITDCSQNNISTEISQSMKAKHTCLCCSSRLLRHVSSEGVYWRCSSCHQEMPV